MKLPEGYALKVQTQFYDGPLRPKCFWVVSLFNIADPEKCFVDYARMDPFLMRIRLWLGVRAVKKMQAKFSKFAKNHGLK